MPDNRFQFIFHHRHHVRPGLEEILEISGREHKHLARAVHAVEVIALTGFRHLGPVLKVREFLLWFLREEVVGEANRKFPVPVEFTDHSVVVWIVLKTTPRINRAGKAKAVKFPEKKT